MLAIEALGETYLVDWGGLCADKRDLIVNHSMEVGRISDFVFLDNDKVLITNDIAHIIQKLNLNSKKVEILAGIPNERGQSVDGTKANEAKIAIPKSVFVNSKKEIFFSSNTKIRRIDSEGKLVTIAGIAEDYKIVGSIDDEELAKDFFGYTYLKKVEVKNPLEADLSYLQHITQLNNGKILFHDTFQLLSLNKADSLLSTISQSIFENQNPFGCSTDLSAKSRFLGRISDIDVINKNSIYIISLGKIFKLHRSSEEDSFKLDNVSDCLSVGNTSIGSYSFISSMVVSGSGEIFYFLDHEPNSDLVPETITKVKPQSDYLKLIKVPPAENEATKIELDPLITKGFLKDGKEVFYKPEINDTSAPFAFGSSATIDSEGMIYFAKNLGQSPEALKGIVKHHGFFIGKFNPKTNEKTVLEYLDFMDQSEAIKTSPSKNELIGLAVDTTLNNAFGLAIHEDGLIVGNGLLHQIYVLDEFGNRTILIGNGTAGKAGDGGLAIDAQVSWPTAISVADSNTIFFFDYFHQNIRVLRRNSKNEAFKVYTVLGTRSKNNCATKYEKKVQGEGDAEILSASLFSICKGELTFMTTHGSCSADGKISLYYAQEFEKKYGNLVSVEYNCD